jgi:hypothetical protein
MAVLSRLRTTPKSGKLPSLEETAIIQVIPDLDSRGFPP